jgi:hypothetical protein
MDSPTLWGKYARHHQHIVGEALKNRVIIIMDDPALLSMTVEITRMMEADDKR